MANPIKSTDIAKSNAFDKFIKGAEDSKKALDELLKSLVEVGKVQKKAIEQSKKEPNKIKKVKELNKAVKKSKDITTAINKTREQQLKLDKQIASEEAKLVALNSTKASQVAELNRLKTRQNQINKEEAVLNDKNAGTLERLSTLNKKLKRERSGLNLETAKGKKRLTEINKELDKNNKKIKDNSSALEKQRQNVGNYADSIKEAAGASGLFGGVLGKLSAIQGTLAALTKKNVVATEADVVATEADAVAKSKLTLAQRALNVATGKGVKALKALKIALASSGIGVLLLAIGGLVAFFQRSQDGVDALSDKMSQMSAVIDVIIDRFSLFGRGLVQIFTGLGDEIKRVSINAKIFFLELAQIELFGEKLTDNTERIKELNAELEKLGSVSEGIDLLKQAFASIGDELEREVALAKTLNELTRILTREQKLFEAEQAKSLTTVKELTIVVKDKLQADQDRLDAVEKINKIEIKVAEKQLDLQKQALASALDSVSADATRLELGKEQLDFIERIKNGTIDHAEAVQMAADFTLSSAAGEQALFDIVDKIVEQERARQNLLEKQSVTAKRTASITKEIANKRSTELAREASALKELAKNEEKLIEDRIKLLRKAAEVEIESFEVRADANIINEAEAAQARIQINARTEAAIKKLREGTLKTGDDGEGKRLANLEKLRQLGVEQEIQEIERVLEVDKLTVEKRINLLNKLFDLRIANLKAQAKFEAEQQGKTAEEIEIIMKELEIALAAIENERVDAVKSANEAIENADEESAKKRLDTARDFARKISTEFNNSVRERNRESVKLADEAIKRTQDSVNRQAEIAAKGGENILAEEQARLDKARLAKQRELERAAREEQNLALATAFINDFSARAATATTKKDINEAFLLALRDTVGVKLAAQGLASLSSAYDGTEDTGNGEGMDSKNGKLWMLHPNERVMTKRQNAMVGDMSNDQLASLAYDYQNGTIMSPHTFKELEAGKIVPSNAISMRPMIEQMQRDTNELKEAFEKGQSKYYVNWNAHGEAVETHIQGKVKKMTTFKRPRL